MNLALKRLHDLKKTTLAPFLDKWHTETEFNRVLKFGTYKQLMSRFAGLELKLAQLRQEIDIDVRRYPLHPGSVSILLNQALPLFAWQTSCPVCNRLSGDDDILHNLERKGDFARAYLTRLSRLSRHFVVQYHWSQDSPALLEAEICGLYSLAIGANESIQDALTRHNLFETLPDESQYNSLYRPDEINFGMALDEQADIDCLGRTGLHQALDAVPILEKEYVQPRAILLAQLLTFLADRPLEYINQQDILGRTLLHIATQKGWTAGVRQLLDKGADTSLKTVYGSLPLHYAAASGNLDILKMLRNDLQGEGHANHVDVRNNTALYYACGNKNPGVIDELLSQVDPNVGGTAETPLPLLKVVELGDKDLAQTLVNAGADSTFLDDPPPGFVVNQALTIYTPSGMEV
ncbi:ankyrin [Bimuria novae-zelandiae CBS 107.79]|uniref:Ankyrin n=1 Tax=Bimuria novae-zelandiae CBS 107.79 TaxID=1447943 RepID=A0A6A5VRB9_9PLEO|nr:ankyrin [Bimuria novae-zelandiae CBS 107.79]